MNLAKSIKIALIRSNKTRSELAEYLDVSERTVDNYCTHSLSGCRRILQMADFFELTSSEFIALGESEK